jgi:hypothetical protein
MSLKFQVRGKRVAAVQGGRPRHVELAQRSALHLLACTLSGQRHQRREMIVAGSPKSQKPGPAIYSAWQPFPSIIASRPSCRTCLAPEKSPLHRERAYEQRTIPGALVLPSIAGGGDVCLVPEGKPAFQGGVPWSAEMVDEHQILKLIG